MSASRYLYRGTTSMWPGNQVLQDQRITCTTTDPLVACLFGVECRNHGHAVVLMAREDLFLDSIGPPNHFAVVETVVNLTISPEDFTGRAERILEVDEAVRILAEMGFDQVPIRIRDKWALREALIGSYQAGHRLSAEQLQGFNARALGATP